jgi:aminopeptidase S
MRDARAGRDTLRRFLVVWSVLLLACGALRAAPSAHEVAAGLSRLGPRPEGGKIQEKAVAFLTDALRRAGLREVRAVPVAARPSVVNVEGVLPGETDREIVLSGHYDTVRRSPGAADDASGCGLAIATAADLAQTPRTPLRHTIRVVLFDAEETGLHGSRGWVQGLSPAGRDRILANVNLEMVGWPGSTGPTIHAIPVSLKRGDDRGERVTTPGWLVRVTLEGGRAAGWPLHVGDPRLPLPMQLLLRGTRVHFGADSGAFLEQGIPAVTLSDSSFFALDPAFHRPADTIDRLDRDRLAVWTRAVAAMVRRMDRLGERPAPEDEYLVLAGQVWSRWALAGIGLALAVLLVVRHRFPLEWHFPVLLAAACLIAPALAAPLLAPAALLALGRPAGGWRRVLWTFLGLLPLLLYLLLLGGAWAVGLSAWRAGYQESWTGAALVIGALGVWAFAPTPRAPAAAAAPPARPAS